MAAPRSGGGEATSGEDMGNAGGGQRDWGLGTRSEGYRVGTGGLGHGKVEELGRECINGVSGLVG